MMNEKFRLIVREDEKVRNGPGLWIALTDITLFIVLLLGFAYFQHVKSDFGGKGILVSPRDGVPYAITEGFRSADNGGDKGLFEFDMRFLSESPTIQSDGNTAYYKDAGCEIALTKYVLASGNMWAADIYVNDIARLKSAFANDFYGNNQWEGAHSLARRHNAILAIAGDYYFLKGEGPVLRNGVLYSRDQLNSRENVCVIGWDGEMRILTEDEFDIAQTMDEGAYQIWQCGAKLVSEGAVTDNAREDSTWKGQMTALGIYEGGHYCFLMAEGNVSAAEMAENLVALGCREACAINGRPALVFNGEIIAPAGKAEMKCGDMIMISR